MYLNYDFINNKFLRQKVDDLLEFILSDLRKDIERIDDQLLEAIERSVEKFTENMDCGEYIYYYDNGETLSHISGFVRMRDGEIVDYLPYFSS